MTFSEIRDYVRKYGDEVIPAMRASNILEELDNDDTRNEAFAAWVGNVGFKYACESFEDAYRGTYARGLDYVDELLENEAFGPIPEPIAGYIDCDAILRDLEIEMYFFDGNEGCHIFDAA